MAIADRDRKLLWGRAADRCSLCRQSLSIDPAHPGDPYAVLGEECHIVARSPGGPRSGEIDPEALDAYENLILLCATDHKLIDDQPRAYPSKRLRSIKLAHEQRVRRAHEHSSERARIWFNVPHAPRYFTGRESELQALCDAFDATDRTLVTRVIAGLGGVGKSQLAARYVHRRGERYRVVAWIRAEDGGLADLASLAVQLGESVVGLSPQERAATAVRWLNQCQEPWLLVLDNVRAPQQIAGCCPSSGNGRVLITTRHRELEQFGEILALGVFDDATAAQYLRVRAGRPEDLAAHPLARALGALPLALSHAGAYCATGTSFGAYLDMLSELPASELFDTCPEASYQQTVGVTWQVSIAAAGDTAVLARPILQMSAYLAPERIPRRLFQGVLRGTADIHSRKALSDALNALHRFCLIEVDEGTVSVHRLLQKIVRDAIELGDRSGAQAALSAVSDAFPPDPSRPETWSTSEELVRHALALADAYQAPGGAATQIVELLNRACCYLNWAERGERAVDACRATTAHATRHLGNAHPAALEARNNQGEAYHWAGRSSEAIAIQEPLVADLQRLLGADHVATFRARNNLAASYRSVGRTADAIAALESLTADSTKVLGAEHPATLRAVGNLAASYCAAGRLEEAITIEEAVAAQRERDLGAVHPETLSALHNLAYSYEDAGRSAEAIKLGERVLSASVEILGNEHPATLRARSNLTYSYRSVRRIADAIRLGEIVLAQRERILGAGHPDTVSARANLRDSYRAAERETDVAAPPSALPGA